MFLECTGSTKIACNLYLSVTGIIRSCVASTIIAQGVFMNKLILPLLMVLISFIACDNDGGGSRYSIVYPEPAGSYSVGRTWMNLVDLDRDEVLTSDSSDKREIFVTFWYPVDAGTEIPVSPFLFRDLAGWFEETSGLPDTSDAIHHHGRDDAPLAGTDERYPVIIMSHGDGGYSLSYTGFAEALASSGFIVVGINHPWNALLLPLSDGSAATMNPSGSIQLHVTEDSFTTYAGFRDVMDFGHDLTVIHAEDMAFLIDSLEEMDAGTGFLSGRIDLDNIGAFGHSLGGANAMEALRTDDRIDAAADLDGTMYLDEPFTIDKPMLQIHSNGQESDPATDAELLAGGWTQDQVDAFNSSLYCCRTLHELSATSWFYSLEGTGHLNFCDSAFDPASAEPGDLGPIDPLYGHGIIREYLLSFFNRILKGENDGLLDGDEPWPEVTVW
jgi:hypothetical protein